MYMPVSEPHSVIVAAAISQGKTVKQAVKMAIEAANQLRRHYEMQRRARKRTLDKLRANAERLREQLATFKDKPEAQRRRIERELDKACAAVTKAEDLYY